MEVLRASLVMVVGFVLPWLLQRADRRRLDPEARARAWNFSSWGSAIYAFGPLSMLGWCWTTRPPWRRCAWGALFTAVTLSILLVIDGVLRFATGAPHFTGPVDMLVEVATAFGIVLVASFALLLTLEMFSALRRALR
jgi:hypothetical protein